MLVGIVGKLVVLWTEPWEPPSKHAAFGKLQGLVTISRGPAWCANTNTWRQHQPRSALMRQHQHLAPTSAAVPRDAPTPTLGANTWAPKCTGLLPRIVPPGITHPHGFRILEIHLTFFRHNNITSTLLERGRCWVSYKPKFFITFLDCGTMLLRRRITTS